MRGFESLLLRFIINYIIVAVADLVMHQIVALGYVGSNPIGHLKTTLVGTRHSSQI